ncbi:MAG: hypothetical protein SGJ27_31470 [Candidatus Melainabacteria bacterium]|nr:hypothetical protein [Candidatus Melainabacteria bacterium]
MSQATPQAASAQTLKHFYMARQQMQITDDAPLVNDQRTFQTPGQPGQNMGGVPNRPVGLPRAGFQQYYTPPRAGFNSSLPQVVNGVPPKEAPPVPVKQGKKATANKLKATKKTATTAKATAPPVTAAKAYSPYKGYSPTANPAQQTTTASGNNNMQSKTRVKGVLHWARGHQ